jgi:uroporphyrinogen-III decarboxylase
MIAPGCGRIFEIIVFQHINMPGIGVCLSSGCKSSYRLLDFITEATIERMRACRKHLGWPERSKDFGYADDSIALISAEHFREHVLPYHRRLVEAFWTGEGELFVHLCGDVSRHFPILHEELGATHFDTGFPIDLHEMRRKLGPDVLWQGGPPAELLRSGPVEAIESFTRDLLSGPAKEGRLILREGNNLAPRTPPAHVAAMYEKARHLGRYD